MKSRPSEIAATLELARIAQVRRMGKHIVFDLERKGVQSHTKPWRRIPTPGPRSQWIVHLGMTGRMLVSEPTAELEKHTHAIVTLGSGRELRFVDPRRFGRLSVASQGDFEAGGSEPLEVRRSGLWRFFGDARRRSRPLF